MMNILECYLVQKTNKYREKTLPSRTSLVYVLSKSCMLHLSLNILALKFDFLDFLSLNQNGVLHLVPLEQIECVFVASTKRECCWLMHVICRTER